MARDRAARPEAKPRRLFVAVELSEAAQEAIDQAIAPWRAALPKARWTPIANRHVTVRFLGAVWPRLLDAVGAAVAAAAAETAPFELSLAACGRFPDRGGARVLWVGLNDPAGALAHLAGRLDARLPAEVRRETRPFAAHLTVARSNPAIDLPASWAAAPVASSGWRVDHLTLFESHLRRPHARYEPLERLPLGDVAAHPAEPR